MSSQSEPLQETCSVCPWPKMILFGDSITQFSFSKDGCWGTLLADYLQRRCDVLVRGFSGYNTRWCREVLHYILPDKGSDIVAMTIFLGANDSNSFELNPRQHVPLEEYKENLTNLVTQSLNHGVKRESIILITPPAFCPESWAEECKKRGRVLSKNNEITGIYAKVCGEVAEEMGTPCVDLYTEMMKSEDFPSYLNDGLHLSEKGSQLLFDLLQPIVDKLTSHLPVLWFPSWDEVDVDNCKECLKDSLKKIK